MEFLLLASAHFLALLSPGPDFFLVPDQIFSLSCRPRCAYLFWDSPIYCLKNDYPSGYLQAISL